MIFYSDKNVYEAALDRIRFIFNEFPNHDFVVNFSGGKDSTTILNLAHEVAKERGIKKIKVFFLDQEIEAPQTIEYVRYVMKQDWVEPIWFQSSFKKFNGSAGSFFYVFEEGKKWIREKEPDNPYTNIVIDEKSKNVYRDALHAVLGDNYVTLGGVRIQESTIRRKALLRGHAYKDITWCTKEGKNSYIFYPIYDWSCYDVWHYIFSNRHEYCKLYNYYFSIKPLCKCRVASFTDPKSLSSIYEIKAIAPRFYEEVQRRIKNVNSTVHTYKPLLRYINELPVYFSTWKEYVYYLAEHLLNNSECRDNILKCYDNYRKFFLNKMGAFKEGVDFIESELGKATCRCIIAEDISCCKIKNEEMNLFKYFKENERRIKIANKK